MLFKDYIEAVEADMREVFEDEKDYMSEDEKTADGLFEYFWIHDCVTGNGSGSYTFSETIAQDNVKDLLFDEDFICEIKGIGEDVGEMIKKGAEYIDVTARCLALFHLGDAIEELAESVSKDGVRC